MPKLKNDLFKKSLKIVENYNKKYNVNISYGINQNFLDYIFKNIVPVKQCKVTKKVILKSIILNMFNYNFWVMEDNIHFRSKELVKLFDDIKVMKLLRSNKDEAILQLKNYLCNAPFKNSDNYLWDINQLSMISNLDKIVDDISKTKSFTKFAKILKRLPSYGNDKFYKREALAYKMIYTDSCIVPIDYRIPTVLYNFGVIQFPKEFDKFFKYSILKSKEVENVIRAISFITCIKLEREFGFDSHSLDTVLFLKPLKQHLRFETTDY